MKLVCFLFALIALFSVSYGMLVSKAGGNTTFTWSYPTISSSGSCTPNDGTDVYSSFLLNATGGAGIYRI